MINYLDFERENVACAEVTRNEFESLDNTMTDSAEEVECPICQTKVPQNIINKHIDSNCTVTGDRPPFYPHVSTPQFSGNS